MRSPYTTVHIVLIAALGMAALTLSVSAESVDPAVGYGQQVVIGTDLPRH